MSVSSDILFDLSFISESELLLGGIASGSFIGLLLMGYCTFKLVSPVMSIDFESETIGPRTQFSIVGCGGLLFGFAIVLISVFFIFNESVALGELFLHLAVAEFLFSLFSVIIAYTVFEETGVRPVEE